ncbi:MAG: ATP-binding protein [Candidatus Susulua stagnicola]|nr:ATP-binding protein [Candidatus Susulua stagnicola]
MKNSPFKHNYFLGYICEICPEYVTAHFPSSVLLNKFIFSGEEFNAGLVGDYITIEGENHGFLGRVTKVGLSERERMLLTEKAFGRSDFQPKAMIELLLSFDSFNPFVIEKGMDVFPNIGAKVFVCSSKFLKIFIRKFGCKNNKDSPMISFATLASHKNADIEISQQALFGRHCAIVGTTGGGKSWTVSKLIEGVELNKSKAILLDATGEYHTMKKASSLVLPKDTYFHYSKLTVDDIFMLLRPAGQVQAPKLMDAIKSLKVVNLLGETAIQGIKVDNGCLIKSGAIKKPFDDYYFQNISTIEKDSLTIDIQKLAEQVLNECIWESGFGNDYSKWGTKHDGHIANCSSLLARISNLINANIFKDIFGFDRDGTDDLIKKIDNFLADPDKNILRIGFENVGYDFQGREILANAIAKNFLLRAREGKFKENPLILFVDEAHQYLNKRVQDEYFMAKPLDAFDQIAKECRKYGLFLCLATQMPRDIPIGTLSQMGTFIVHRLINFYDKEAISNACSSANKSILSFLPVLGEGEAILTGVDFPMPLSIKVVPPDQRPDSGTPEFAKKN